MNEWNLDTEITFPWPNKGDQLFKNDSGTKENACLNYKPGDWFPYIEGYKLSGDILVHYMINQQQKQDVLVYPVLFMYRQYLELRMKHTIILASAFLDVEPEYQPNHNIQLLWKQLRKLLVKIWPDGPKDDLDAVEACIIEFAEMDPNSMSFRYPVDKKGNPIVLPTDRIDLRHLSEVMNNLDGLLSSVSDCIDNELTEREGYQFDSCDHWD